MIYTTGNAIANISFRCRIFPSDFAFVVMVNKEISGLFTNTFSKGAVAKGIG